MIVANGIDIKRGRLGCLLASGAFFLMMTGSADAQMSSTNCMVMGGGLISCNTMDMGHQSNSDGGAELGKGIGRLIASVGEKNFRKKIGGMLADGDCQGAARYAYEKGRLELGASITAACQQARQPAALSTTNQGQQPQINPNEIESALVRVARGAKTPMEMFEDTTISKVDAIGNQLVLTALVDRKGASITENGRMRIVRDICASSSALLKAGAVVRIDFYQKGERNGRAFDTVMATRRECGV